VLLENRNRKVVLAIRDLAVSAVALV
jgi:hypothetical protein